MSLNNKQIAEHFAQIKINTEKFYADLRASFSALDQTVQKALVEPFLQVQQSVNQMAENLSEIKGMSVPLLNVLTNEIVESFRRLPEATRIALKTLANRGWCPDE